MNALEARGCRGGPLLWRHLVEHLSWNGAEVLELDNAFAAGQGRVAPVQMRSCSAFWKLCSGNGVMSCCTGDYRGARMAFHWGHAEGTQADNVTIRKVVTTELVIKWSYCHISARSHTHTPPPYQLAGARVDMLTSCSDGLAEMFCSGCCRECSHASRWGNITMIYARPHVCALHLILHMYES